MDLRHNLVDFFVQFSHLQMGSNAGWHFFLTLHPFGQQMLGKILLHDGCTPSYALVDFDDVMI